MADDDMADGYMDDDDDAFEWLYVEDTCPLADELAETSVPDPGYAGTNFEIDMFMFDYDLYDYWDDLEYGYDHYWDYGSTGVAGGKRKSAGDARATPKKRRKVTLKETGGLTNVFVSMEERKRLWSRRAPVRKELASFALLPDWRKRCVAADTAMTVKAMPAEMRQAAESKDEEAAEGRQPGEADGILDDEAEWEDEGEDDELGEVGDMPDLGGIDQGALKTVLRQKLGDAGLTGLDEDSFMATITKMLAGGGGADNAMGDLANALLGSIKQDGESAAAGWLSQQGVSLEEADEGDDAESTATAELQEDAATSSKPGKGKIVRESPPDSAIEMGKGGKAVQIALRDGSPKAVKKRLASIAMDGGEVGSTKRKRVSFDAPEHAAAEKADRRGDGHEAMGESDPDQGSAEGASPDVEEGAASQPIPSSMSAAGAKPTSRKGEVATPSEASAPSDGKPSKISSSKVKAEPAPALPAKQTRKRKAQAEDDEPPPPAKRATRMAAAGAAKKDEGGGEEDEKPSYARATRATRARSGK